MLKLIYLFLIFQCAFLHCLTAQTIQFEQLTTKDGLLSDEVYNLHQDKEGYIWLFTNYGSMKYNGKTFEPVLVNLSFNESIIYSFFENENGQKWCANSNAKIFEVKNDSAFLIKGTENTSEELRKNVNEIYQLFVDDTLNIYASTKHYTYKFCKKNNYAAINLSDQIPHDSILISAMEFKSGIVNVLNYPKYDVYNFFKKKEFINIQFTNQNLNRKFYKVKCGLLYGPKYFKKCKNDLYFSFYSKIVHINSNNKINELPINSVILNFTKDKNNHLWVACYRGGLYEFNENDSLINHYFENKTINDVLCDSQNGLWVSSSGNGLFHCKDLDEAHFTYHDFLGKPISFIKPLNNVVFIANNIGDVFLLKNNSLKKINNTKTILGEPSDIIETKDFYIVSSKFNTVQISKLDNSTIGFTPYKFGERFYTYKMKIKGRDSLICLQRKDLLILLNNKIIVQIKSDYKLYDIEIRNGIILVATDRGVYQIFNNKLVQPIYLNSTGNCVITKISKDLANNYWFCSKGCGVFKLSPENKLTSYSTLNCLPSNIINDISFVSDEGILLSTNKGLYYSNKLTLIDNWKSIYSEEVSSSFLYNNKLFLSTKNGLIIIDEKKINSPQVLYFNLVSVSVNSMRRNSKFLDKLNYFENSIEFNFDIILFNFSLPPIKYNLIGHENYSGTVKNRQINFQNLSPGSYTLIAMPDIKGNSKYQICVPFTIIPAFWQTNWFFSLCIIFSLLICIYSIWRFVQYYKVKENKKNEANRLITEYKLIALKAQINPHFMSNCLTAIQHLIISGKVDSANQYLAKFSLLVRQVLNFSSKPLVTLKEELEITQLNIELEQLRFENKFLFEIVLDKKLDLSAIFVPPLILQPIIENAIWHGLLPLKKIKIAKLIIEIYIKEDAIYINIEDNGVGRKNSEDSIGNLKESKGIDITKQRIFNLNDYYNTNRADLIYEDLFDTNNNAVGTKIIIALPLNLSQKEE